MMGILKMNKLRCVLLLCVLAGFRLYGWDLGFLLNQKPLLEGAGGETSLSYTGVLVPWFSAVLSENADLYLSGGITAEYDESAETSWQFLPELYRFEAVIHSGSLNVGMGRLNFSDLSGYIASGLFDGVSANFTVGKTGLAFGAFYTGFLYKKTANITMTAEDSSIYNAELDYGDFSSSYFAARRAIGAAQWELSELLGEKNDLILGILAQFDLNDTGEKLHSQYVSVLYSRPIGYRFTISAGGTAELMEADGEDLGLGFAAHAEGSWMLPTGLQDRLSLGVIWSSGEVNDTIRAFVPISTVNQGQVLRAKLSGLMRIHSAYTVRLIQSLSAELGASYFMRTDDITFSDPELPFSSSSSYFLGGEISGSLTWVPVSDISLVAGGGVFLPALGNAIASDAKPKWLISMGAMISF
jgi:hypothetical protein